ncbi:MAG: helix-turn-helix domain-containing protein [Gammaproteobacteria bacterium]|nr:helix-turn-helix domain-containing protein [Gammaproteobacteria bacterium]
MTVGKNTLPGTSAGRVVCFGDVSVTEVRIAASRPGERVATTNQSGRRLQLVFVLDGEVAVDHRNRELHLGPLEWGLCDDEPVLLSACEAADALVMSLPGTLPSAAREAARCATGGVGQVLLTCLRSSLTVAGSLTSQARAELGQTMDQLARVAIHAHVAPAPRLSGRSVMRDRVKAFVRHHLRDSQLSIEHIAQAFNCTKRYLHKVFSEDERSLNQYIWDLRLDRCSQDLANAELRGRSITEIAFLWGFRSSPHFSRVFRQRFGTSPSAYRSRRPAVRRAGALTGARPAGPARLPARQPAGPAAFSGTSS